MRVRLVSLNQPDLDREYEFAGPEVHIGRDPVSHIAFPKLSGVVSWKNARIDLLSDRVYIEDLHSTNGTYINGERLLDSQRLALEIDDTIQLGLTGPKFRLAATFTMILSKPCSDARG
jgi:pSer/pThr/pTyr-binding forkhead associated (FHA) protein